MRARFVKKCKCDKKGRPVLNAVDMKYGAQVDYTIVCPKCGIKFREVPPKGKMKSDINPVIQPTKIPEEPKQVTTPPVIDPEDLTGGKNLSFGERMKIAKAKKKEEREAEKRAEKRDLSGVVFDKDRN